MPRAETAHPSQIGPYKILEPLGEGGMGTVCLAEQEQPVQRRVALKLMTGTAGPRTRDVQMRCRCRFLLGGPVKQHP